MVPMREFPQLLSDFFGSHLRARGGMSENTVLTYRDSFVRLLEYMRDVRGVRPDKVTVADLGAETIQSFLDWLETDLGASVSTRNNRLAAIRSFFRYVSTAEPAHLGRCSEVLSIAKKREPSRPPTYLTTDAVRHLLSLPDQSDPRQLRALCVISLLYESGARVSELCAVSARELRLGPPATLLLHGKGGKDRIVPIDPSVAATIGRYMAAYGVGQDEPLFFNARRNGLTREGVSYILRTWFDKAKALRPDLYPERLSPHCMRHSRAMHLLEAGVNLVYIRDLLGHSSVETTEVYAKANPEVKRRHIERAGAKILGDVPDYDAASRDELLAWLKSGPL